MGPPAPSSAGYAAHRRTHMPPHYPSSAETNATIARVAPAVLALLGDGAPRSRRAIVAALAERHPKEDVVRTLMRLAVTGRLVEAGRKYHLAADDAAIMR
jgi:hypothetical protein